MTKSKWFLFEFEDLSGKRRKLIANILLISQIAGYIFLVLMNILIVASVFEVRVYPNDFSEARVGNETITLEGELYIENNHWYSVDIFNIEIDLDIYTDDDVLIFSDEIRKDIIPRLKDATIHFDFEIFYSELPESFIALNKTEYIELKISVKLFYALYGIDFEISYKEGDLFE